MHYSTLFLFSVIYSVALAGSTESDTHNVTATRGSHSGLVVQDDPFDPPNCADRVYETQLVDDGSPTKWTYWQMVSGEHHCGEGSCGIEHGETVSWSIGFSVTGQLNRWISGGFSVSEGHSTTETVTCGAEPGQSVCIWFGKWHEEYTVQNLDFPMEGGCGGTHWGSKERLTSPMEGGVGFHTWCGHDDWCKKDPQWDQEWYGE